MAIDFGAMQMADVWQEINSKLNSESKPIEGLNLSYSFDLSGEDGGIFGLKLTDGKAETIAGDPGEVDCALTMSVKDFKKLLTGNLNSTASFMMGKLKVKGNMGLALKLEGLLKQYSF